MMIRLPHQQRRDHRGLDLPPFKSQTPSTGQAADVVAGIRQIPNEPSNFSLSNSMYEEHIYRRKKTRSSNINDSTPDSNVDHDERTVLIAKEPESLKSIGAAGASFSELEGCGVVGVGGNKLVNLREGSGRERCEKKDDEDSIKSMIGDDDNENQITKMITNDENLITKRKFDDDENPIPRMIINGDEDLITKRKVDDGVNPITRMITNDDEDLITKRNAADDDNPITRMITNDDENEITKRNVNDDENLITKRNINDDEDLITKRNVDCDEKPIMRMTANVDESLIIKRNVDDDENMITMVTANEDDNPINRMIGYEDENGDGKGWNLRPRRRKGEAVEGKKGEIEKASMMVVRGKESRKEEKIVKAAMVVRGKECKKEKKSVKPSTTLYLSLSKEEIMTDLMAIMASRPNKKLKKRSRSLQNELNRVFPCSDFGTITPRLYEVQEKRPRGVVFVSMHVKIFGYGIHCREQFQRS
ncbi:Replicase polyprotein 1a-like protein [Drosera capensis]